MTEVNDIIDISDDETEAATNYKIDPLIGFHWDDSYGRYVINTRNWKINEESVRCTETT